MKPGDKVTIKNDDYPEFYIEVRPVGDRLIISIFKANGELLTEAGVKQTRAMKPIGDLGYLFGHSRGN